MKAGLGFQSGVWSDLMDDDMLTECVMARGIIIVLCNSPYISSFYQPQARQRPHQVSF